MRRIFLLSAIIISVSTNGLNGQNTPTDTPKVLETLYSRLSISRSDSIRIQINDSIRFILESYISSDTVFKSNFKNLHYLGQITAPDSSLKIITWNLILPGSSGRYFCYLIRRGAPGKENRIYKMSASYNENPALVDTTYTQADWYGALYYDIRSYTINNNKCWVLLGIDYGNLEISRKIIDVLNISSDDSLTFGRKWFESKGRKQFRVVFEYASNAMMSLKFKTDSSIVFDHLVPFSRDQQNSRQFYGPDYSYDAYNFSNGSWKLIENVDARNKQ